MKLLLYNSSILPIITYVCPIWTCKTAMDNLSSLHNKIFTIFRNASRYLQHSTIRRCHETTTIRKPITDISKNLYANIYDLLNEIVVELPDYDVFERQHADGHDCGYPVNLRSPNLHFSC